MKFLSPLLLFALLMFSCADRSAGTTDDTTTSGMAPTTATDMDANTDMDADMDTDMDQQVSPQLEGTVDAVESAGGDITALPASAAVSNIDGWISELSSMPGTESIVGDLNSLKSELGASDIDGGRVSELLSSLADQTRSMESKAPGLSALASALQAGADKLGGK